MTHYDGQVPDNQLPKAIAGDMTKRYEPVLRWSLIVSACVLLVSAYFAGIGRGLDGYFAPQPPGPFLHATCAVATKWLTGIGDYVCLREISDINQPSQHSVMRNVGLREDVTSWDYLFNRQLVDDALKQLFAHPHWTVPPTTSGPPYDGIQGIGWGMDEGYYNFVDLAYRVFGPSLEALYKGYWLVLGVSIAAYLIAFRRALAPVVLLLTAAVVQYMIFSTSFLWFGDGTHLTTATTEPGGPHFLSCLCVVPLLHFVTLARRRGPLRWQDAPPLAVQSLVLAMAILQRTTVVWVVMAMILLAVLYWLRYRRSTGTAPNRRYYPMAALTLAVALSTYSYLHLTTHPGFAAHGYTHGHNLWFTMVEGLSFHPDWKRRYAPIYGNADGDVLAEHVCRLYLADHREEWPRWNPGGGDPFLAGFPQTGLEELCRKAFFEFARRDPIYVAQVWLYHPLPLRVYTANFLKQYLSWLVPLPLVALLGVGLICGLISPPARRDIAFYWPAVALLCMSAVVPNLASAVTEETLTDYFDLLAITVTVGIVAFGIGLASLAAQCHRMTIGRAMKRSYLRTP